MRVNLHPLRFRTQPQRAIATTTWTPAKSSSDLFDAIKFDETVETDKLKDLITPTREPYDLTPVLLFSPIRRAVARKTRIGASLKKLKQVVKQVSGMPVEQAIRQLEVNQRKCSRDVLKCVKMARANAKHLNVPSENLVLAEMIMGTAPMRKNIQFHAKGRIGEWFQRYSHLTVVLKPLESMKGRKAQEKLARVQINKKFRDWQRGVGGPKVEATVNSE